VPALATRDAATVLAMAPLPVAIAPTAAIASTGTPLPWLAITWLGGALLTLGCFIASQRRFLRALGPLRLRDDGLMESDNPAGLPAVVGWRARIVVPADFEQRFDPTERELVLCHERMHRRRGDVPASIFAALLRCVFWFNPLLHFAARRFADDQELACDAAVLRRHPNRRRYAETLLKAQTGGLEPAFGTRAFGTHPLNERIRMLTRPVPATWRWLAGACFSLLLACGVAFAAWAAQPATTGSEIVYLDLRFALDGEVWETRHIGLPSGTPFVVEEDSQQAGEGWRAELTVTPIGGDQYLLKGAVDHGGARIADPVLQVQFGREAVVEIGGPGGEGSFLLAATVRGPWVAEDAPSSSRPLSGELQADAVMFAIDGRGPVISSDAVADGRSESVMLRLYVAADGRVTRSRFEAVGSTVTAESPLVATAQQVAAGWTLTPVSRDGMAVAGEILVPIAFEPEAPR
jgi:bla regulator protein BlaR1